MKQLDPKAVWIFFFRYLFVWVIIIVWIGVFGFSSVFQAFGTIQPFGIVLTGLAVLLIAGGISYIVAKLSYHFYRYELRADCFRKESGIIWKRYISIPYERIQNVDIHRGIIARILGLSDLQIQTAGSSAVVYRGLAGGISAEGSLPGVSQQEAESLRDALIQAAKGARSGV